MRIIHYIHILLIVSLCIWYGCTDSSSPVDAENGEQPSVASCEGLRLEAEVTKSVSKILVHGLDAGFGEEPFAWIYDAENDDLRVMAYMERVNDNDVEMIVPFHPGNWREGGDVEVVVVSDDESTFCEGMILYIEALEPAEKNVDDLILDFQAGIYQLAENYGYNIEDLRNTNIHELDVRQKGLAAVIQGINGVHHPNNILAQISGEAPVFENLEGDTDDPEFWQIFNAILAESGFMDLIENLNVEISHYAEAVRKSQSSNKLSQIPANGSLNMTSGEILSVLPEELDEMMADQAILSEWHSGYGGQSFEITKLMFGSVSAVTGLFGLAPVAAGTGIVANYLTIVGLFLDFTIHALPSELQGIELEASPVTYYEDQEETGVWSATLEAHSKTWTLTWPDVVGLVPVIGPAGKIIIKFGKILPIDQLTVNLLKTVQHYFTAVWRITEDTGPFTMPSRTFEIKDGISPGRDNEGDYFHWDIVRIAGELDDDAFTFGADETEYNPVAVGVSELRVRIRPGKFGDEPRTSTAELEVKAIEIEIRPRPVDGIALHSGPPFYVLKNDEDGVPMMAVVSNAVNPQITWELSGDGNLVTFGSEKTDADYIVPSHETTDLVIVRVDAAGGARDHPQAPNRSETARIHVVESPLVIEPTLRCVQLDQTVQFTALFEGDEIMFDELEWEMDGPGSLGTNGVFVPMDEGKVNIEFWLKGDRNITYTIEFEVQSNCSYLIATGTGAFEANREAAFEYTTNSLFQVISTCISLEPYEPTDWYYEAIFGNDAWVMTVSDEDGFRHDLFLHKSLIEDQDGEWEKWIEHAISQGFEKSQHGVYFRKNRWFTDIMGIGSGTIHGLYLQRRILEKDGEKVPVYSGNYYNHHITEHESSRNGYLKVEFEGVVPGEGGCF